MNDTPRYPINIVEAMEAAATPVKEETPQALPADETPLRTTYEPPVVLVGAFIFPVNDR